MQNRDASLSLSLYLLVNNIDYIGTTTTQFSCIWIAFFVRYKVRVWCVAKSIYQLHFVNKWFIIFIYTNCTIHVKNPTTKMIIWRWIWICSSHNNIRVKSNVKISKKKTTRYSNQNFVFFFFEKALLVKNEHEWGVLHGWAQLFIKNCIHFSRTHQSVRIEPNMLQHILSYPPRHYITIRFGVHFLATNLQNKNENEIQHTRAALHTSQYSCQSTTPNMNILYNVL